MSLAIVYLNYFSSEQIKKSIKSIINQLDADDTILIGDNSNDSAELDKLMLLKGPNVIVYDNKGNHGFSRGNNLIIKKIKSKFKWLLLINPDTVVDTNFLLEFRKALKKLNSEYYAISPLGYWLGTKKIWAAGGKFYWLRGRADVLNKERLLGETQFGTCACLFIRQDVYEQLGGLDEDYFLGGEEWQLSLGIKQQKGKILFNPKIMYEHAVSGTHEKYGPKYYYLGIRTKLIFVGKNYNLLRKLVFWAMFIPYSFLNIFTYSARHNLNYFKLIKISLIAISNYSNKLKESEISIL